MFRGVIHTDVTTGDDDTDSDDGESEYTVESMNSVDRSVRVLSFHAPVAVINRVLTPISVRIIPDLNLDDVTAASSGSTRGPATPPAAGSSKLHDRTLQPGERLCWYHEHWDQIMQLQVKLDGFEWSEWTPVDKSTVGRHWVYCADQHGAEFQFGVDVVQSPSGSLRVAVFVPIWVFNRGAMPLMYQHCLFKRTRFEREVVRPLAGQIRIRDRMSRFRQKLRRSQVGLLALVPRSEAGDANQLSQATMLDYTFTEDGKCIIQLQGPETVWSVPVDVTTLTSGGVVVEVEEDKAAVLSAASADKDSKDPMTALTHRQTDFHSRHSVDPSAARAARKSVFRERRRSFVFGISLDKTLLESMAGTAALHGLRRSTFVTVAPRFVVVNTCQRSVHVTQHGQFVDTPLVVRFGDKMPFHWPDSRGEKTIRIRFAEASWTWSGAFSPNDIGETVVRIRNEVSHSTALLRVEVKLSDSYPTLFIIVRAHSVSGDVGAAKHNLPPPYRIHNFTVVPLRVQQLGVDSAQEVCLYLLGVGFYPAFTCFWNTSRCSACRRCWRIAAWTMPGRSRCRRSSWSWMPSWPAFRCASGASTLTSWAQLWFLPRRASRGCDFRQLSDCELRCVRF